MESVASHTRTIGIIQPLQDIASIVEVTARYVSINGPEIEKTIIARSAKNSRFKFLSSSHPYHAFYQQKLTEYIAQIQYGVQATDSDGNDAADKCEAGFAKPDLQPQFRLPSNLLECPEPEKYTVRVLEGITFEELDIIRLTALFVSRNGRSFFNGLLSRESNNPQFQFMKPTHSLFTFFTALVGSYSDVLMPHKDFIEKLRKNAADVTTVLERCLHRLEWNRSQEQQRKKEEEEKEQERVQVDIIDWRDFAVVELIDFADEEDKGLPPPITFEEVARKSKMSDEIVEPGMEVKMEMDEEDVKLVAEGMGATYLEENGGFMQIENVNDEEAPMRIVKNWNMPVDRIPIERDLTKVVVSPITGELIPITEMTEYMRISLIDPKFIEQKNRMFAKIRETTLAQEDEIAKNIVGLGRLRPDIFGTTEEVVSNAVKAEIAKKIDEQPKQVLWDGHTGSIVRTANQALTLNTNGEEQADGFYGPAALPPRQPDVSPVWPLSVPMMQTMHPQHKLSMPEPPRHPSMIMN